MLEVVDKAWRRGMRPEPQISVAQWAAFISVMLLVTVRDAAGNGIDPGDLQLTATASVLPDPPTPLALRAIQTDGMTDYLGVVQARAPATVTFKLIATRAGARADIATTAELQPR